MNTTKLYKGNILIGIARNIRGKFWFQPILPGRKRSKKGHINIDDCIPSWAKKISDRREVDY